MEYDLQYGLFGSASMVSDTFGNNVEPVDNKPIRFMDDDNSNLGYSGDSGGLDYELPDSLDESTWQNDLDNNENNSEEPQDERMSPMKVAVIAVIAGLVLIMIVFSMLRFTGGPKEEKQQTQQVQVEQVQQVQQVQTEPVQQPVTNIVVKEKIVDKDGWVLINDRNLTFDKVIQSTFTLERVEVYARPNGSETNVKAVAVGTITGLTGKYELEIPYQGLEKLVTGTVLNVEYQYLTNGDAKVISAIKII